MGFSPPAARTSVQCDVRPRLSHADLNTPGNPLTTRGSPHDTDKHQTQTISHLNTFFLSQHFVHKTLDSPSWTIPIQDIGSRSLECPCVERYCCVLTIDHLCMSWWPEGCSYFTEYSKLITIDSSSS